MLFLVLFARGRTNSLASGASYLGEPVIPFSVIRTRLPNRTPGEGPRVPGVALYTAHSLAQDSCLLEVGYTTAFAFLADPTQWPRWTNAFASVLGNTAVMRTPEGEIEVTFEWGPLLVAEYSVLLNHFTEGNCYSVVDRHREHKGRADRAPKTVHEQATQLRIPGTQSAAH